VRNYVDDNGRLVELTGIDGHRDYFDAFFAKYDVRSVGLLHRVAQEWYLFGELRLEAVERATGTDVAFHTAEIYAPGKDGCLIARIGYGTDVA
jgi:hypothetical protein